MYLKYNNESNVFEFKQKFELNSMVHEFIHLKNNNFLFIHAVNEQNSNLIEIKCLENNQVNSSNS